MIDETKVAQLEAALDEAGLTAGPSLTVEDFGSTDGGEVDWDKWELDEAYAHFYSKAYLEDGPRGLAWTAFVDVIETVCKPYNGECTTDRRGEFKRLDMQCTAMMNAAEPWKLVMVLPSGAGMGAAVLSRQQKITLPTPKPRIAEGVKLIVPGDADFNV